MVSQQAMQRRAQCVNIAAWLRHAMQLFWRRVANGHNDRSLLLRLERAGNAKVDQFDLITGRHHNIRWLEIAENNGRIQIMKVVQDAANLLAPTTRACL